MYLDAASCEEQERDGHQGEHHSDEQHAWHRQVQAAGGLLRPGWRRLLPCKHARQRHTRVLLFVSKICVPKLLLIRQSRAGLQVTQLVNKEAHIIKPQHGAVHQIGARTAHLQCTAQW